LIPESAVKDWKIRTDAARADFEAGLRDSKWLTPEEAQQTEMFKANQAWAQKLRAQGYTIVDLGDPSRLAPACFASRKLKLSSEETNIEELDIVRDALPRLTEFLFRLGFRSSSVELLPASAPLGARLEFIYHSEIASRSLSIYYELTRPDRPARFSIVVSSQKLGETLSLFQYLRNHEKLELVKSFSNTNPALPTSDFCENAMKVFRQICEADWSAILTGKSWIPSPIDWGPYK
jgi:hypothetical protein